MFFKGSNKSHRMISILFVWMFSSYTYAATPANIVPGSADAGRIQQQVPQIPAQDQIPANFTPQIEKKAIVAPAGAEKVHFKLKNLSIERMSVYTAEEVAPLYREYLGQDITLAELYEIANRLTRKYRNDGYFLSQVAVPAQEISKGEVKLVAVEAFISRVVFQPEKGGEKLAGSKRLKRIAASLTAEKPLRLKTLERTMLLMNDLPGVQARAVLKASPDVPFAADVYVLVSRKRVEGNVEVNNRGNRYLGPLQEQASITANGVFDENDALSARLATTYQMHEMKFGELKYSRVLADNGLKGFIRAGSSVTHPGSTLAPFKVTGTNRSYSAGVTYPWVRGRSENLDLYTQLDWSDVKTKILNTPISEDHIRTGRLGALWRKNDSYLGFNAANIELSHGLPILGASDRGDAVSRPGFNPTFTKVNGTLSREQLIRGSSVSLYGAVTGQYASSALLPGEEFGVGGENFGSAYDSSEITGESGAAVRLEARYLVRRVPQWVQAAQPYVFYDAGFVHNRDVSAGVRQNQTLEDAGVGVRVNMRGGWNLSAEVADPITRPVASLGRSNSPRFFFRVGKTF